MVAFEGATVFVGCSDSLDGYGVEAIDITNSAAPSLLGAVLVLPATVSRRLSRMENIFTWAVIPRRMGTPVAQAAPCTPSIRAQESTKAPMSHSCQ